MTEVIADVKQVAATPEGPVFTHRHAELRDDLGRLLKVLAMCAAVLLVFAGVLSALVFYSLHTFLKHTASPGFKETEQIYAFWAVFTIMTLLIFSLAIAVVVGLAWPKPFSLSDALSSPSPVQPKIEKPEDILMLGSTSRLIAFVGLLGILCLAVGVGYSVVFSILINGQAPDLKQASWFLAAMASLFAPYLANQVKEAITHSKGTGQATGSGSDISSS